MGRLYDKRTDALTQAAGRATLRDGAPVGAKEPRWEGSLRQRRRIVALSLVVLCLALAGAAAAPPATSAAPRTALLRERLLLLQGYLERYANAHYSAYPGQDALRKGGTVAAPVWPRNPWTGAAMRPGSKAGDFTYTPAPDRLSYRLAGHYPGGSIVLRRGVPYTRKMQNDHRTREQVDFIRQLVQQWAHAHDGRYPPVEEVAVDGSVGQQAGYRYWPHNVWTHRPIAVSSRWGDFGYTVDAARESFALVAHFSRGGHVTLGGDYRASPWRVALVALQDEIVARNGEIVEGYVREWGLLHSGVLPTDEELAPDGAVATTRGAWPVDPFSGEPMRPGDAPGCFAYGAGPGLQYEITVYLSTGSVTLTGSVPLAP